VTVYQTADDILLTEQINEQLRGMTVQVDRYDLPGGDTMYGLVFSQGQRRGVISRTRDPFTMSDMDEILKVAHDWMDNVTRSAPANRWVDDHEEADAIQWD